MINYLVSLFWPTDPNAWTAAQVHAWLRSTLAQFKLPPVDNLELQFSEDGAALALLSEEEFQRRLPEVSSAPLSIQCDLPNRQVLQNRG